MISLLLRSGGSDEGGGQSPDETLNQLANGMLEIIPMQSDFFRFGLLYNVEEVKELYAESMSTVLTQELLRLNNVVIYIRSTLQQLVGAAKGLITMPRDLEHGGNADLSGACTLVKQKLSHSGSEVF